MKQMYVVILLIRNNFSPFTIMIQPIHFSKRRMEKKVGVVFALVTHLSFSHSFCIFLFSSNARSDSPSTFFYAAIIEK